MPHAARLDAETKPSASVPALPDPSLSITPAMLHSLDIEGRLISVSDAWLAKLGYAREEVLGRSFYDLLTPKSREYAIKSVMPEFFRRGSCENVEYQMVCKDGRTIDVLLSAVADQGGAGRCCTSQAVITDVTALKAAERHSAESDIHVRTATEQRLKESEARYRLLAEHSTDMVLQLDLDLVRRYVSPACREIFGYEPEELIGRKSGNMAHPDEADDLAEVLRSLLDGSVERSSIINRRRHRDGRWIWVESQFRTLKDPQTGAPTGIIAAVRDISARKAVEEQLAEANRRLEALAAQDALTGLANRRAFDDALMRECKRALRDGTPLGLVMLDVDCFKSFNDRYGHPAGDDCLRQISGAIENTVHRPADLAARYGGEEFAVLLPDTDEPAAAVIAERIRQAVLVLALQHEDRPNRLVSISAGVASLCHDTREEASENLLRQADRALYRAKDSGRNRVVTASSLLSGPAGKTLTIA